jgi:hypothetical protein
MNPGLFSSLRGALAAKQSISGCKENGLLRGACHRARISRDPLARYDGKL